MQWNHRTESVGGNPKSPALTASLQGGTLQTKKLVGPIKNIYPGTDLGLVEGRTSSSAAVLLPDHRRGRHPATTTP